MAIYDRPTKTLMREFAAEVLSKGKTFSKRDAIAWFAKKYPKLRSTTIDMHVNGMSINNRNRKHHRSIKPGSGHDLFYKIGADQFRLWDADADETPLYASQATEIVSSVGESGQVVDEFADAGATEFALESDLQNYVSRNLGVIEAGLTLYEDEGLTGIEFPADGRRIDLLCEDKTGGFVVIELKVSRGYDRVVGQILRYMAWVKKNIAQGKPVRGIIVAAEISEDLKLAASMVSDVSLVEYEISFQLKKIPAG
ncbi:MAG TPA: endonuclease NucS domain-containing protein [Rhizomicrobium sp.]|jgi:hypothetical protein